MSGAAKRAPAPRLRVVGTGIHRRLDGGFGSINDSTKRVAGETCGPQPVRPDSFELASSGLDPNLQLIGGDPWASSAWAGLVVPNGPTVLTEKPSLRFLFLLAWMRLDARRRGRIRGIRTTALLGATIASTVEATPYFIEQEIQNPFWKTNYGNICYFLRRIPTPGQRLIFNTSDGPSLNYLYANTPSLLYISPPDLGYIPPNNGVPPGVDLSPGLGAWYDGRFGPWRSENAWGSVDIAVQGPCDIGLFASVYQMPQNKPVPPPGTAGLPPDDAFLMNFPTAQFTRIAGSFIWEEVTAR